MLDFGSFIIKLNYLTGLLFLVLLYVDGKDNSSRLIDSISIRKLKLEPYESMDIIRIMRICFRLLLGSLTDYSDFIKCAQKMVLTNVFLGDIRSQNCYY